MCLTNEWSEKNIYNSFNSFAKGLTYYEYYESINNWRLGKIKTPRSPVEVSLDPIHACNLKCSWCNASRYLKEGLENRRMSDEHLMKLITFLAKWGVRGTCWGGGGESLLHSKMQDGLELAYSLGLENSIATNGTLFNSNLINTAIKTCKWIGMSIDAATKETYFESRKIDLFDKAISNLQELSERSKSTNSQVDIAYKFLIFKENQHEIYKACELAKKIGVKTFHCRPASYTHQGMELKLDNPYDMNLIEEEFEKCRELEDKSFNVFLIRHKFNPDFSAKRDFSQCWAGPLCIQICADNNVYNCPDTRHLESFKLGEHYPNPEKILEFWGSKKHYNIVFNEACKICNWRCTFGYYAKQFQDLFIDNNDPLFRNFV
jgi:MoaA/NifB/PqqE/SkfB family radical SAM enzyme